LIAPATTQTTQPAYDGPIIDIHQHVPYSGRTAEQLIAHQAAMGITMTILLPAGSRFGLDAAGLGLSGLHALRCPHRAAQGAQ